MGKAKVSERARLISYTLGATDDQLLEGIELFQTVLRSRGSRVPEGEKKTRTRSTKKGLPTPNAGGAGMGGNGDENES